MADEQDIKIKIATEANTAGAKQAEEALRKVEDQAKKTADAESQSASGGGFGGQLDGSVPRDEAAEAAAAAQKTLADAMDETSKSYQTLLEDQRKADVARAQSNKAAREQAAAEEKVAQSIHQTASATRMLTFQLGAMAAGQLAQGISGVNKELGGIINTTAQGAAAAGPWGAVIGALLGSVTAVIDAQKQYNKVVEETEEKIKANDRALLSYAQKVATLKIQDSYKKQWEDLAVFVEGVNQAVRDNIELENARRNASVELGSASRGAEEASIKALRQTGAISAQQEAAQLAELKQREAEANKQAAIAEAQAQQAQRQATLDDAKRALEVVAAQKEIALRDLEKAQTELRNIQEGPKDGTSISRQGVAQAKVDVAQKAIDDAAGKLSGANSDVTTAENALQQGLKLLEIEVNKIAVSFDAQGLADQAAAVGEKSKEEAEKAADQVRAAIDKIVPQNKLQADSLVALNAAIADGELSKNEAAAAVQQLSVLGGNLNTELGKILGVVTQMSSDQSARDRILQNIISQQQAQARIIQELAAQSPQ
jgi:hypothetical protein